MHSGRARQALIWTPYDWVCLIGVYFGGFPVGREGECPPQDVVYGWRTKTSNQEHSYGSIAVSRAAVSASPAKEGWVRGELSGVMTLAFEAIADSILSQPLEGGAEACEGRISAALAQAGCGRVAGCVEVGTRKRSSWCVAARCITVAEGNGRRC